MTELDEKTDRLVRLAHDEDLGGILLTTQPSFAWLTGGGTNRIDGSRENGNGVLFVRHDGRRFVIANAIEMPRLLGEELRSGEWEPIDYPWTEDHTSAGAAARLAAATVAGRRIGSDAGFSDAALLDRALMRARAPLVQEEVERYRRLGADAGRAVGDLCRGLHPGESETGIARRVSDAAAAIGGRTIVNLVAADPRIARYRHPVPTSLVWRHVVLVVACIERHGLIVALSRIVAAGNVSDHLRDTTHACSAVFRALLDATRPGATGAALFQAAVQAYRDARHPGEELRHHQGGAIGYRSRDWIAHPASEETVGHAQAFAWNPSITGTKIEDTALLTSAGIELITASPGWPSLEGGAADILRLSRA